MPELTELEKTTIQYSQFTLEEWSHQLKHPAITYWPLSWRFPFARFACALCYAIGGALAMWVIVTKLGQTAFYIWRNT